MNVETALYTIGAKIVPCRTIIWTDDNLELPNDIKFCVKIDGGYVNSNDMRKIGEAYVSIANHLDELNKEVK